MRPSNRPAMRYATTLASAIALPLLLIGVGACVGTDLVEDAQEPELRLTARVDALAVGEAFRLEATFFDAVGREAAAEIAWESDRPGVLGVDAAGLATALAPGRALVTATALAGETPVRDTVGIAVADTVVDAGPQSRSGRIETQSSYELAGDFTVTDTGGGVRIEVAEDYVASTALPGLYVYLSNNDASTADALEIGPVEVFRGAHAYTVAGVGLDEYRYLLYFCKPFNVRVGSGEIQ